MLNSTGQIITETKIDTIISIILKFIPSILLPIVDIKKYGIKITSRESILFAFDCSLICG
jgi:hypothetical protein